MPTTNPLRNAALVLLLASLLPVGVSAQSTTPISSDAGIRILPLVTFRNHGYFRFRFNEMFRADLGPGGASGYVQSLDSTAANESLGRSSANVETANMRFRYEPSLLVGEFLTLNARIDFLDNVVFGSNPGRFTPTNGTAFWADTQKSPSAGLSGFSDAVRVKAAWADLRLFQRFHLVGGRMTEHFGLGMLRNAGNDIDADYGDSVDAIYLKAKLVSTWARIGMEFPGEGVTSESPFVPSAEARDLSQSDDITRWVLVFDSSPTEKEEFEARRHRLDVERKPAFDWGMYHSLTDQDLSSERVGGTLPAQCDASNPKPFGQDYDCYTLTPRGAFFWTPALWGRAEWHPRPDVRLRVEAEWAMIYGHVNYMQSFLDATRNKTRKDFLQFGTTIESELEFGANQVRLYAGVASGGSTSGRFGILDGSILAVEDDVRWSLDPAVGRNSTVRNFVFNRDYRVDSILFRQVIGSVTNAFYFKPAYRRTFLKTGRHDLSAGASLLAAFAVDTEGTPGGKRGLGVEAGLDAVYNWGRHLTVRADGAVLFPLSGMKQPGSTVDPRSAAALRLLMGVQF